MSAVTNTDTLVQNNETQTRNPTSESLFQKIGGIANFLLGWTHTEVRWNLNGPYKVYSGKLGVDGIFQFPKKSKIIAISLTNLVTGTSGTTEIDIKTTNNTLGTWTSIFTTTPKFTASSVSGSSVNLSSGATGTTVPVMITTPFNVSANDYLRMDVISVMDGGPQNLSVTLIYAARV